MPANTQERIDFILNYEPQGAGDVENMAESLRDLERSGNESNETLARARQITEAKTVSDREGAEATEIVSQQQVSLARATENTNEVVRESTIAFELLKLEYQEGEITLEQYSQGLTEIRQRLEGTETTTLAQARSLQRLSTVQRQLGQSTQGMTRQVRGSAFAMNSFAQILQDAPFGLVAISNNIPFAAQQLQQLTTRTGSTTGALQAMLAVIRGPGGMILLLTSLVPLIAVLSTRMDGLFRRVRDVTDVSEDYVDVLRDLIQDVQTLEGMSVDSLFDTTALEEEQIINEEIIDHQRERIQNVQELIGIQNDALRAGRSIVFDQEYFNELLAERASREEIIEGIRERQLEIENEILTAEIRQQDPRIQELEQRRANLEATEEQRRISDEINESLSEGLQISELYERNVEEVNRRLEERTRFLLNHRQLLENLPAQPEQESRDERDLTIAQTQHQLAEEARLAAVRDSLTQEEFIRQSFQQRFQRERLDFIRQGITDEESLNNLRLLQEQELQDELTRVDQEQADARMNIWQQFAGSVQGLGEAIVGSSKENARQAFAINKALALAQATAFGVVAIIRAWGDLGPIAGSAMIASVAAQLAKLQATRYNERGGRSGSGDRPTIAFRGVRADTTEGTANTLQQDLSIPDTLRLEDSEGNLLTKLEWARDRRNNKAYVG